MKCKICRQKVGWFYPLFNYGRCVHCKLNIERMTRKPPTKEYREEYREYARKSDIACDKWAKENLIER